MAQYDVKSQDTKEYNSSLYKGVSRGCIIQQNLSVWLNREGIIDRDK